MQEKIIIIGLGMVGFRLCQKLREKAPIEQLAITVIGEEPHLAYDRVHLSSYLEPSGAQDLSLAPRSWYGDQQIQVILGTRCVGIDRVQHTVQLADGQELAYDRLILATGSAPFVPSLPGIEKPGVYVYRTIDDLEAIRNASFESRRAAVMGGGLLGLEAAKALLDLGLETSVIEFADRLMPRQLDAAGSALLQSKIEALGVRVLLGRKTQAIHGDPSISRISFQDHPDETCDMLVISAGIRPRDELARMAGLELGPRGGILVSSDMQTSDPHIYAIGECASFEGLCYGLVAPGYRMADVVSDSLLGKPRRFQASDLSTRLKLLGVEVASIGDPLIDSDDHTALCIQHHETGIYKKLVYHKVRKTVVGAILVGDASVYSKVYQAYLEQTRMDFPPENLLIPGAPTTRIEGEIPDADALVCSCENICRMSLIDAIRGGQRDINALKQSTKAGTGCGSCVPILHDLLQSEREKAGETVSHHLCEHFALSRPELYQVMKASRIRSFDELLSKHGQGGGCEICKPTVASILASLWNEHVLEPRLAVLQDSNDRYLANIQVNGTYSIVPRIPAGEITPDKLLVIAQIAMKYQLYTKITGGQRIDLFGARLEQLPEIWRELIDAGFESGHAYGKAVRTVKSCVGSTWCRYGVQDSVAMALFIEHRYKGIRAPHKIKFAVSGCARECAEAQSKDIGVIATEKGWNLYVCGNGGMRPAHAQLLATDLDDTRLIQIIDRFLMYYIRTADRLTRTASWLKKLPRGLQHLREVLLDDKLGLAASLEAEMTQLVNSYQCEWKSTLADPEKLKRFRTFVNTDEQDPQIRFEQERGQIKPLLHHSYPMQETP